MSWMHRLDSEEYPWKDPRYRQYMAPLLACGQILARELGHTKAVEGAPLLARQLLEDQERCLFDWETLEILDTVRREERSFGIGFALRALCDFENRRSYIRGSPSPERPAGMALLSVLGAAYLMEGMPNAFSETIRLFALLDATPSAWPDMEEDVWELVRSEKPLLWHEAPRLTNRTCFDGRFGLTPLGLAFFGSVPVDTRPRPGRIEPDGSFFPDRRSGPRRTTDAIQGRGSDTASRRRQESRQDAGQPEQEVLVTERPEIGLDDLVLSEDAKVELAFVAALLREGGDPPVMLFHGPPGTGKTHAARCLAGEVRLPLGATSLDRLLCKWHGDTEKGLARAFAEAECHGAVLLLDEADVLLYDRRTMDLTWQLSQVNTLLKLLEAPSVPVILCTNFLKALDSAVHRRIQHMIEFPLPGYEERRLLWKLALGELAVGVDLDTLACVPITGGLIRNAVVQAGRRRRVLGERFGVDTGSLMALARQELPKMDREVLSQRIGFMRRPALDEH